MDVIEAILTRRSVRDFGSGTVPKDVVLKILETALRSPSAGNSQPWEVFVASGESLEKIRSGCRQRYMNEVAAASPPPAMPPRFQERMATIRRERLELLGLDPNDPASGKVFLEWGSRLFGAPVLLVICMDKSLPPPSYLDIGSFVHAVCLAARGLAVDSLIAGMLVAHQDLLRHELGIPDELNIVIGIALGYANGDNVINSYRSPRRPLQEVVRYRE